MVVECPISMVEALVAAVEIFKSVAVTAINGFDAVCDSTAAVEVAIVVDPNFKRNCVLKNS